ncbi:hypothetical protein B0H11DRAFT_200650 [Mycena galericulata]|nr:hypothetical protein B0H11DRAFT_200650 [Mycena galericulata]
MRCNSQPRSGNPSHSLYISVKCTQMHFPAWILAAFVALDFALFVSAGVYFIEPASGSICTGGSPCQLQWLDDGNSPLENEVGVVTAGMFTGNQQLVQSIPPLDVASVHSVQFTPNAQAGPNSDSYYIAFTSTTDTVNGTKYVAFSPFFTLKGMSGSFSSPLAAATSTIPIPASLTHTSADTVGTTIVVGSVGTSLPPLPTTSAPSKPSTTSSSSFSSRFTTSSIPTSSPPPTVSHSATGSPTGSTSSTSTSNALHSRPLSLPVLAVLSLLLALSSIS